MNGVFSRVEHNHTDVGIKHVSQEDVGINHVLREVEEHVFSQSWPCGKAECTISACTPSVLGVTEAL
jgi:hypothetical protein